MEQKKTNLIKKILFKLLINAKYSSFSNKEYNGIRRIKYNRKDNNVINKSADITEYINIKKKILKISKISNNVKLNSNIFFFNSIKNYLKFLGLYNY